MPDRLINVFADELDVDASELSDESSAQTVDEWDSLAAMRLVSAIEEEFLIRLSTADIIKMDSIGRARIVLKEKGVDL